MHNYDSLSRFPHFSGKPIDHPFPGTLSFSLSVITHPPSLTGITFLSQLHDKRFFVLPVMAGHQKSPLILPWGQRILKGWLSLPPKRK